MRRSELFYRDLLELPCRLVGERGSEFDPGGGTTLALHVDDKPSAALSDSRVTLCLEVVDLDATVDRLRAAGYAVDGPTEMAGVGRLATFRDPDGVAVSLAGQFA